MGSGGRRRIGILAAVLILMITVVGGIAPAPAGADLSTKAFVVTNAVTGGGNITIRVTLAKTATKDETVRLNSNRPSIIPVPATMTIKKGQTAGSLVVATKAVRTDVSVNISGTWQVALKNTAAVLVRAPRISALRLGSEVVLADAEVSLTVRLNAKAPVNGLNVGLRVSKPYAVTQMPSNIVIREGSTGTTVRIRFQSPAAATSILFTATLRGVNTTASILVKPIPTMTAPPPTSTSTRQPTLTPPLPTATLTQQATFTPPLPTSTATQQATFTPPVPTATPTQQATFTPPLPTTTLTQQATFTPSLQTATPTQQATFTPPAPTLTATPIPPTLTATPIPPTQTPTPYVFDISLTCPVSVQVNGGGYCYVSLTGYNIDQLPNQTIQIWTDHNLIGIADQATMYPPGFSNALAFLVYSTPGTETVHVAYGSMSASSVVQVVAP